MRECTRWRLGLTSISVLITALASEETASARPSDREQCALSAEQAQLLRDDGKYRQAREQILVCVRDVCPGPIKIDCAKWLMELDRDAPTVVFGAKDQKGDLFDVKVSIDGVVVQERLDGKPVLVDSGEHVFKFESKAGEVQEKTLLLRAGAAEKARLVIVSFGAPEAPPPPPPPPPPPHLPVVTKTPGSLVPAIVAGGAGVVALASFATFGLIGRSEWSQLESCKPHCNKADIDSVQTNLLISDVSLGVSVVALGVATYLFFTRPHVEANVTTGKTAAKTSWLRLDGGPIAGGGVAGLQGGF